MNKGDKKRQEIVDFITQFIEKEQFSPTTREISKAVGVSQGGHLNFYLNDLRRRGFLTWKEGYMRTIRPVSVGRDEQTE